MRFPSDIASTRTNNITVGLVSKEVGEELERRLANNETLTVRFPDDGKLLAFPNKLGAAVDVYSAWGLANDLSIKPVCSSQGFPVRSITN